MTSLSDLHRMKLDQPKVPILDSIIKACLDNKKLSAKFEKVEAEMSIRYAKVDDFHDLSLKVMSKKEIDIMKGELKGQIGNLKSRIQDLTLSERDLQTQLGNLREMHDMSASLEELQGLSQKLDKYAPLFRVTQLESDLRSTYRRTGDAEVIEEEMKE